MERNPLEESPQQQHRYGTSITTEEGNMNHRKRNVNAIVSRALLVGLAVCLSLLFIAAGYNTASPTNTTGTTTRLLLQGARILQEQTTAPINNAPAETAAPVATTVTAPLPATTAAPVAVTAAERAAIPVSPSPPPETTAAPAAATTVTVPSPPVATTVAPVSAVAAEQTGTTTAPVAAVPPPATTVAPVASPVTVVPPPPPPPPAPARLSETESGGKNLPEGALVYSKMATIVPDAERGPLSDKQKAEAAEKWGGKWSFWDGGENERPMDDYCAKFPNRDIPRDEFPENAWQADAVFVNHLLDAADKYIKRVKDAIFTEYGHGPGDTLTPQQYQDRYKMFAWEMVDMATQADAPEKYRRRGSHGSGGWTTQRSYDGLVRRLLHAMMTNDKFTVVMGGHSAAAGHGNHFDQSYMMQFHQIMAPVFARLGVKLVTRNIAFGGLGTIQSAMGSGSLLGDDVDLLLWDSGMTESTKSHIDLFYRQALLGGKRVPVLWGGSFYLLKTLHEYAEVDVGEMGNGFDGVIKTTSAEQAKKLPHAVAYMVCEKGAESVCSRNEKFCGTCWIPRSDIPDPLKLFSSIRKEPPSRVRWHPGWRYHQLVGRVLAFSLLDALETAVNTWSDSVITAGAPLDDDFWHVTEYYKNIQDKVAGMPAAKIECSKISSDGIPERICNVPMQARTLFTPRPNGDATSLMNLVRAGADGKKPQNPRTQMFTGPNAHNPCYDIPPGQVDLLAVVSARRRRRELQSVPDMHYRTHFENTTEFENDAGMVSSVSSLNASSSIGTSPKLRRTEQQQQRRHLEVIVPGKGWQIDARPGRCDGEYGSDCNRAKDDDCPALGHHDYRGQILGNEFSGWLVLDIPNVQHGLIMLKFHTWLEEKLSTVTKGWTTVNNERRRLDQDYFTSYNSTWEHSYDEVDEVDLSMLQQQSSSTSRRLGLSGLPETFFFDYSIDGKVTSLNKQDFIAKIKKPQRVVEVITLLDDPLRKYDTVEVAFRLRGCGRSCTFGLTHVYWA